MEVGNFLLFPTLFASGTDMSPELPTPSGFILNKTENRAQSCRFGHCHEPQL